MAGLKLFVVEHNLASQWLDLDTGQDDDPTCYRREDRPSYTCSPSKIHVADKIGQFEIRTIQR
ncbi:unnamed protein product [Fusarium graminearum]|uniref:Chromosome 4, complete genome n=2 Tax=Gibberella zeae TaxID=5518 RepID=A0A098DQI2_GIBZE|nr:unnamed protein product [Fusarium graminearum]CAF3475619.1 unnamed protein product [Fusarium graminearum]CAF3638399.1 unnamed protein product [Fusarium graminearum]CAG1975246.1 unnamed protein product [Fusarium graminearum]CAG1978677.1 unnamed protein product [Fusarium graminearum]